MLLELSIKNLAIIDDLQISFSDGLTVLSGETGAGKSIIINAINLLLGARATSEHIRTGCETAEIEALFAIPEGSPIPEILDDQGYEPSEELLIRRILSQTNRHKVYVNGRISTMALLRKLTENLASISGQHAHQKLLNETEHLLILDQFGGLTPLRERVRNAHRKITPLIRQLDEQENRSRRSDEHIAFLKHQQETISAAAIVPGEDEELESELVRLRHAETLYQTVHEGIDTLYMSRDAIIGKLVELKKQIDKSVQIDPELETFSEKLESTSYQLEDCVESMREYKDRISLDGKRLEEAEARLNLLKKLKRQFGGSLKSVIDHLHLIEQELEQIDNISFEIEKTRAELDKAHQELSALAGDLSEKRKQAAESLSEKVEAELAELKMEKTRFTVSVSSSPVSESTSPYLVSDGAAIFETGMDQAAFLISPNVGEALKPLSNIASGGELSRVVLSLRVILANKESAESLIFDEVDSGIGGGVAEIAGEKLVSISRYHQVICITHLAQIAQFGDSHYRIAKHVESGRTRTTIRPLDDGDRLEEIARMLGGVKITQTTMDHAREMVERVKHFKSALSNLF